MTRREVVPSFNRREVLALGLSGAVLAGCVAGPAQTAGPAHQAPVAAVPDPSTSLPSPSAVGLPTKQPWRARTGEVHPAVKASATGFVQAVGDWGPGQRGAAAAQARVRALGLDAALVPTMSALLGPGTAATTRIVDAQYGGILPASASVLVVVDQWRAVSGTVKAGGDTFDVRLIAARPLWRVVAVHPARPGPAVSDLTAAARAVLNDHRIHLPYAARADIASGNIHESVLALLTAMARRWVVDVSVIRSGHPLDVFGTTRPSDHPQGRAVDVWALDSRPLVEPTNHALAAAGMRFAVSQGAYNVGGPVLLPGPQYFSNPTHQDHIHLGFSS
ncbi:MAG: hypothetical protein ABI468_08750 [Candidatus Nanopelagicales bacterium]